MEKFQSLADLLGVQDDVPQEPEEAVRPSKVKRLKLTAKAFCKEILDSKEYRDSLLRRIIMDELPPAVEVLLYHYAHGKPVERMEVKDVTDPLEDFTAEQCQERAEKLLDLARQLKEAETPVEEAPRSARQVH
jgi:hypothetical protein